ncbi:MAG TPA: glycosyltransferase family 39 protein [Candidatus Polarisedimenticolaceae bacterium]|nr:glycosyltransferase family 39 protein [Candidatus Polarisedimenticolaceae bacterium]
MILAVIMLASATLCTLATRDSSATDDEPAHIAAGYLKVAKGRFDFYNEQPPLVNTVSALPLMLGKYSLPPDWNEPNVNPWHFGKAFLYRSGNDADGILWRTRLPIVGLFVILQLVVYAFAFELTQRAWAALLATTLTAFCPNLLAHAGLATVDLGAALFALLAAFLFLRFLREPSTPRAIASGFGFACAVLTKVSLMLLVPWAIVVATFFFFGERDRWAARATYVLPRLLLIAVVALAAIDVFYLVEMRGGSPMAPFTEYGTSISTVFRWVSDAYAKPQFLLGRFSPTGWWYYYPVAIALKTPLTTLVLMLAAFGAALARPWRWGFDAATIVLFVLMLLGVSCASSMNIGLRHVLPLYPFLYVLTAPVALAAVRRWKRFAIVAVVLLCAGTVVSAALAFPNYIGYFNALVPARNADRYLIDSNLDWGQDLRRLGRFMDEKKIAKIHVWYFGGGDPTYTLGEKAIALTSCDAAEPGYYAISRQYFRGNEKECESAFRDARYVATVGSSILVFEK